MSNASRILAFLAYLLPVVSWVYITAARKDDELAMYHTRQAIVVFGVGVGAVVGWVVLGWALSFIPYLGFIVAIALFSLVMIVMLAMLVNLIVGIVYALQAKLKPLPILGNVAHSFSSDKADIPQPVYRDNALVPTGYSDE